MSTDIRVPTLGESVTEATIGQWFKRVGDTVSAEEPVVELETDKVTIEVPAPAAGVLEAISANPGDTVNVGALIGAIGVAGATSAPSQQTAASAPPQPSSAEDNGPRDLGTLQTGTNGGSYGNSTPPSPSASKLMNENNLGNGAVEGSGRRGQVLKEDVLAAISRPANASQGATATAAIPDPMPEGAETRTKSTTEQRQTETQQSAADVLRGPEPQSAPAPQSNAKAPAPRAPVAVDDAEREERVRMTRLRQTIARRLKDAQNTAAMLTTFNEVDMKPVMDLRGQYKDLFEKKHGVKLGFMGFFTKAVVHALKEIPSLNAEIDGDDLIYKNYAHIGVAVGTEKGLVVPVVRDADGMTIAGIEKAINALGKKARDGQLSMADMQGGTFTISNGGVYGSLMSTPILNAPQSGILGMHKIQERPIVVGGQVVVRPMMYLALSYDHRIVDGKEAVTFLVRVKESLEAPERLVLDL